MLRFFKRFCTLIPLKIDSEWIWILTERPMHNADTRDILYDDSMRCNTKSRNPIDFITYRINILHCQHGAPLYLSVLVLAKHYSKLYHLIQCQCSFTAARRVPAGGKASLGGPGDPPSLLWPRHRQAAHAPALFWLPFGSTCSVSLRRRSRLFVLPRPLSFHTAAGATLISPCHTSYTLIMAASLEDETTRGASLSCWQMTHDALNRAPALNGLDATGGAEARGRRGGKKGTTKKATYTVHIWSRVLWGGYSSAPFRSLSQRVKRKTSSIRKDDLQRYKSTHHT